METKGTFSTRDIVLAAVLTVKGIPLQSLDVRYEGTRQPIGWFKFDQSDVGGIEADFLAGKVLVEPCEFNATVKNLKSMVNGRS